MQPPLWWVLQGATLLALLAGTCLAYASSGRIGRHTPYGGFLFVIALGFWFITTGVVAYVATVAVDAWDGPPGWGDAFTMSGWALIVVAFYLLLLRFPRPGAATRPSLVALLAPLASGAVFGLAAWWRVTHGGGVPDAEGLVRIGYVSLDGLLVAVFLVSGGVLMRLRRASLGRLYLFLGAASVLKSLGDILFLIWPRDPPLGLLVTALYPLAGGIVVLGLALHHRAVAPLAERQVLADPRFVEPQLVLRDAARGMRGLAGELGERLVLGAGRRALEEAGVPAEVRNGVVLATAPADVWRAAVDAARERAGSVLGRPADAVFEAASSVFDGPYSGGRP